MLNFCNVGSQCGKRYFLELLTKEILRQINSLVLYLVKPLFSRNFCQKCVKRIPVISMCGSKPGKFSLARRKNISSNQLLALYLTSSVTSLLSRNFCQNWRSKLQDLVNFRRVLNCQNNFSRKIWGNLKKL